MAPWDPSRDAKIGDVEHLGRRRFKRAQLVGFTDQPPKHSLTYVDFLDERDPNLSVDRLGKNGIDRRVIDLIRPLAAVNAEKRRPRMVFLGWAAVQAKKFLNEAEKIGYSIKPDPIRGTQSDDNEFHAVISCPIELDRTHVALYVWHLFVKYGAVIDADAAPARSPLRAIIQWFLNLAPSARKA
jgi:hypothetical protein